MNFEVNVCLRISLIISYREIFEVTSNFLSKFANSMNLSLKPHKGSPTKKCRLVIMISVILLLLEKCHLTWTCNDN